MSPINFELLQAEYPEYAGAWPALREWFSNNWRKRYIELSVLLRALRNVDRMDVILAIQTMVEKGMLELAYRVKAPGGYLLEDDFDQPDKVPPELPDRDFSGIIKTADSDIVSGYRWEPSDAA